MSNLTSLAGMVSCIMYFMTSPIESPGSDPLHPQYGSITASENGERPWLGITRSFYAFEFGLMTGRYTIHIPVTQRRRKREGVVGIPSPILRGRANTLFCSFTLKCWYRNLYCMQQLDMTFSLRKFPIFPVGLHYL